MSNSKELFRPPPYDEATKAEASRLVLSVGPEQIAVMASVVDGELKALEKYFPDKPDEQMFAYLNNFCIRLPGGFLRENDHREGWWETPLKTIYQSEPLPTLNSTPPKGMSQLRLDQTPKLFFCTVDAALEVERIPIGEIERLQLLDLTIPNLAQMYRLAFPAYIRLRAVDYSHIDFWI